RRAKLTGAAVSPFHPRGGVAQDRANMCALCAIRKSRERHAMKKSATPLTRRTMMGSSAATLALAATPLAQSLAQAPAAGPPAAGPANTDWTAPSATNGATRYAPLDQINATNFNSMEVAWRFNTDNFGLRPDAFFNCTPLVVKGRMYATVGLQRQLV